MKYKHLSILEREKIQEFLWQKKSIRYIAKSLSRSVSSISRELRKNYPKELKAYIPRLANERALLKRTSRGRKNSLKTKEIRAYVLEHLKKRWSPEQISIRIPIDLKEHISHEAIYQFIYAEIHRNGWGYLKPKHEDLRIYLRRRRKRRLKKGVRRCQRIFKPYGISIDERPKIVDTRTRIGDWESDTVESKNHKPGVNTLLERKTGLYLITQLRNKTSWERFQRKEKRPLLLTTDQRTETGNCLKKEPQSKATSLTRIILGSEGPMRMPTDCYENIFQKEPILVRYLNQRY